MDKELLETIADRVYKNSIEQFKKESRFDTYKILTDRDFIEYVDVKIKAAISHNERYTENLIREIIYYYKTKNQE